MTAPRAEPVRHPLVFESVLDLIGDTPLVKIDDFVMTPRPRPRRAAPAPRQGAQLWG